MPRRPRDERPGLHHVVTRGNNKRDIYVDDRDRTRFCVTVDRVATRNGWSVLGYALMRNHYHLLIAVSELGLARGMFELNKTHAVQFNARHRRVDHLFGKRYWSRFQETDASVRSSVRYIGSTPKSAVDAVTEFCAEYPADVALPRRLIVTGR